MVPSLSGGRPGADRPGDGGGDRSGDGGGDGPFLAWRRLRCRPPAPLALGVALGLAAAALAPLYVRLSWTSHLDSDNASLELQSQAVGRGNILLHGWTLSNASFATVDLPVHVVAVALRGLSPTPAHEAAACIYALLVCAAAVLARGDARGGRAAARMLVTALLLLAPAPGIAVRVLLLGPYHVGTTLLLTVALIVLDAARDRWYGPAAFAALLALDGIADPLALYVGAGGVVLVCLLRLIAPADHVGRRADAELLVGAALAAPLSVVALRLVHHLGGFLVLPRTASFAPLGDVSRHLGLALEGTLLLYGADFFGQPLGPGVLPALLHLAGYGLAAVVLWKAVVAMRRGLACDRVSQILVAVALVDLAAYVFSDQAVDLLDTRYLVPCFVFSAVLAGRWGADPLLDRLQDRRLLALALAGGLAYVACFAVSLRTPPQPDPAAALGTWLDRQHLRYGVGAYWDANVVTVETGGRVRVRPISLEGSRLRPDRWESDHAWYDPSVPGNDATFCVFETDAGDIVNLRTATATFGPPSAAHRVGPYTVLVWNKNLLTDLR